MTYAEFYTPSTGWNGTDFTGPVKNTPLLGSDGVLVMDGRHSHTTMTAAARHRANQLRHLHHITGFRLHRGRSFTDSHPVTAFIPL